MADTTISSSSKKLTSDYDDGPIPYAGPPPKKTTTTSSSSDASHPTLTGPTAYDVKDAAKFMPVTTLKAVPSGPMELSLDAQKAVVEKRLARPIDYPERKADEALRDGLARRILDRDAQAKVATKEAQCPSWAACQPVPKGYDPNQGGLVSSVDTAPGEFHATLMGTTDGSVRIGAVDAEAKDRQLSVAGAALKVESKDTNSAGVKQTLTVQGGSAGAHAGTRNADGSHGVNFGAGAAAVSGEVTLETEEGASMTGGAALGVSHDFSAGIKTKGDQSFVCTRTDEEVFTVGACVPAPQNDGSVTR